MPHWHPYSRWHTKFYNVLHKYVIKNVITIEKCFVFFLTCVSVLHWQLIQSSVKWIKIKNTMTRSRRTIYTYRVGITPKSVHEYFFCIQNRNCFRHTRHLIRLTFSPPLYFYYFWIFYLFKPTININNIAL